MNVRLKIKPMRATPGMWLCAVVVGLLMAGGIMGQLQQSGGPGSTVTANAGTNLNTSALALEAGNLALIKAKTDNLDVLLSTRLKPADTLAAVTTVGAVTSITNAVNVIPKTACGNTLATGSTLAAVPTSSTLLTSAATACVIAAVFFNTNGTPVTVTLTDNTGTPINAMLTFSIPANSNVVEPLHGGAFTAGVKWAASGSGVTGFVVAYQ
jgi:hypothetical protein